MFSTDMLSNKNEFFEFKNNSNPLSEIFVLDKSITFIVFIKRDSEINLSEKSFKLHYFIEKLDIVLLFSD